MGEGKSQPPSPPPPPPLLTVSKGLDPTHTLEEKVPEGQGRGSLLLACPSASGGQKSFHFLRRYCRRVGGGGEGKGVGRERGKVGNGTIRTPDHLVGIICDPMNDHFTCTSKRKFRRETLNSNKSQVTL